MSDRQLVEEQYRATTNLRSRIDLHERFSTNPRSYPRWVFDGYDFGEDADVLEVGCGDGMIWRENADRIPQGWRLTLTDQSDAMVEAARGILGDRAAYAVADVQKLPFRDESFDAVIANHMLFHVEDRQRALGEIARVLRPGGRFTATVIGRGHLKELRELAPPRTELWQKTQERFTAETAPVELEQLFESIEIEPWPDSLEVTEAEAVVAFIRSRGDVPESELVAVGERVTTVIDRKGSFRIAKATSQVRARLKP